MYIVWEQQGSRSICPELTVIIYISKHENKGNVSHSTDSEAFYTLRPWMEVPRKSTRQQKVYQQPTSYTNACVRFSLHVLFVVLHPNFLFINLQWLGAQNRHFFPSMIPIVLIEPITSPCKPCLHGILRPSWSKHHYHFPLLHIRLISTLPSFRYLTTLSSRRLPTALICRPFCPHFLWAYTMYHSLSHFFPQ